MVTRTSPGSHASAFSRKGFGKHRDGVRFAIFTYAWRNKTPKEANTYPDVQLYIDGAWTDAAVGRKLVATNPVTGEPAGKVAHAERADLDRALEAADKRFNICRKVSADDRSKVMRNAADVIDWFAEEARRSYGRVIPARAEGIYQLVVKEPVGPMAAFTPWNFPINQVVRKLSIALAAGCSIIVKAPEETPASAAELIRYFPMPACPRASSILSMGCHQRSRNISFRIRSSRRCRSPGPPPSVSISPPSLVCT
jgi:delta 1-pyrroline-5-carboxylate dehydrogenase